MKDEKISRSHGPPWERPGDESSIAIRISAFTYHRIESRKNSMERVFFRCAIQATDSTFTGCRAKIKAAKKPRAWIIPALWPKSKARRQCAG